MSDLETDKARRSLWSACERLAGGNRHLATTIQTQAELRVIRGMLAQLLPTGEAGYWRLVESELSIGPRPKPPEEL
jgi:hypothetical protein